jgi:hypothetical protein
MAAMIQFSSRHRVLRSASISIVAAASVLIPGASSPAAPLPPGSTLSPVPSGSLPAGTVLADSAVPFATASFTGTLSSEVLADDPTNPLGGLTFRYSIQDNVNSPGEIDRLTISSFAGVLADAHFVAVPENFRAPTLIDRSAAAGSTIGFSFIAPPVGLGTLQPGQTSVPMIVYTNSHVFAATSAFVSDGSGIAVSSYATPALPGDVNFDGIVNALDISLVASHWLQSGNGVQGDANYNGVVNGLDIADIASHWLTSVPGKVSSAASVPEPSTLVLAAICVFALLACRRRR